jgi:hypothetical protein
VSGLEEVLHIVGVDFQTGAPFETTVEGNTRFLLRENPSHGLTVGGGVRLHAGSLSITPELRYTGWTGRPFEDQGSRGFFVESIRHQLDLLVTISF